jgi:hypothetical protein
MGGVSGCVTAANRYMPQVRRYVLFMQLNSTAEPAAVRDVGRSGVFHFAADEPRLPGSRADLEAGPGQAVWCVLRSERETAKFGEICLALAGGEPAEAVHIESETFFLAKVARLPERPLRSYLPFSEGEQVGVEKRIKDFMDALGVREEFETCLGELDIVLTGELDDQLSPALRYALRLLPGALAKPHLFVLDVEPLQELGERCRDRVISALADRVVLLVSHTLRATPIATAAGVVVIDAAKIRGIGDVGWHATLKSTEWADELNRAEIEDWAGTGGFDDDDDDEN